VDFCANKPSFPFKITIIFIAPRAIRSLACVCTHSPTQLIKLLIISGEKLFFLFAWQTGTCSQTTRQLVMKKGGVHGQKGREVEEKKLFWEMEQGNPWERLESHKRGTHWPLFYFTKSTVEMRIYITFLLAPNSQTSSEKILCYVIRGENLQETEVKGQCWIEKKVRFQTSLLKSQAKANLIL